MGIDYKSKKWDKEIRELKKSKLIIEDNYYCNIKYVYNRFLKTNPYDYIYVYGCFVYEFELIARAFYIENNYQKMFNNIFLSVKSFLCLKECVVGEDINVYKKVSQIMNDHEYTVCKMISINQLEFLKKYFDDSIMARLYFQNIDEAKKLVVNIPDVTDESQTIYYNTPVFLKQIYLSIINKDEKKFNELMISRVKKYRKNMVGYSTVIDYTSVALIKVAKKNGIDIQFDIVEVPKCFFDEIVISDEVKDILPIGFRV